MVKPQSDRQGGLHQGEGGGAGRPPPKGRLREKRRLWKALEADGQRGRERWDIGLKAFEAGASKGVGNMGATVWGAPDGGGERVIKRAIERSILPMERSVGAGDFGERPLRESLATARVVDFCQDQGGEGSRDSTKASKPAAQLTHILPVAFVGRADGSGPMNGASFGDGKNVKTAAGGQSRRSDWGADNDGTPYWGGGAPAMAGLAPSPA